MKFLHCLYVLKFHLNIEYNIGKRMNMTQIFNKSVFILTKCDMNTVDICYHILENTQGVRKHGILLRASKAVDGENTVLQI